MEELLSTQRTEIDELNRLIRNYKSDGSVRKTERYLIDKVKTFSEFFRIIEEKDTKIQELKLPMHDTQPYFVQKTFETLKKLYSDIMIDIESKLAAHKEANGTSTTVTNAKLSAPVSAANDTGAAKLAAAGSSANGKLSDGQANQTLNDELSNKVHDGISQHEDEGEGENDGGIRMMLYDDIMNMLATSRELTNESSLGFLTAHAKNLDSMWMQFRLSRKDD